MTTDLTDAVLEAMLGGHTQGSSMGDPYCRECMTDWPCDLVRVVTALRSLRSWADGERADLDGADLMEHDYVVSVRTEAALRERLAQKVETQSCGSDCYERAARIIRGTGATT